MRYYKIIIKNPKTGEIIRPASLSKLKLDSTYTSFVNGQTLPGALNVELDIPLAPLAMPRSGSYVKIWGVSREEISQSNDLSFCEIEIYGGMQKGLPLAKPEQSEFPLAQGLIFQAFGNWVGTQQSLDLVLQPGIGSLGKPANLVLNWRANTPLSQALETTFSVAFPKLKRTIAISPELKMPSTQPGMYTTLPQLAAEIKTITQDKLFKGIKPLGGGAYPGVDIVLKGNTIMVYDGTKNIGQATFETPKEIAFEDLIGQPTWIKPNVINFKCVMRSDLGIGNYVRLPSGLGAPYVLTTPGSAFINTPARNQSTFKGKFNLTEVHQFGNFRQADAASWVTSFNAVATPQEEPGPGGSGAAP